MSDDPARHRLRALCLDLEEAYEQWAWGDPTYRVGRHGWIGMRLDEEPDWNEVAELVRRSYLLIAPAGSRTIRPRAGP